MSDGKRPYIVAAKNGCGHEVTIVMAFSKAQALRHVAEKTLTAKPATGAEVVRLMQGGAGIETAGGDQGELTFDQLQAASTDNEAVENEGAE